MAVVAKMAQQLAEVRQDDENQTGERGKGVSGRCRGRPRLTDSDRAQRRLESRKKYDVRRVYLGESHRLWSELRRRTSLSDAGLAEYLILLYDTYGERHRQRHGGKKISVEAKQKRGRKQHVSSLQSLVCWYQEHSHSCPHEPQLKALESQSHLSAAAIWQCDCSRSFVQYLFLAPEEASDSEQEEAVKRDSDGGSAGRTSPPRVKGAGSRKRRKGAQKQVKDVGENLDISEAHHESTSPAEEAPVLNNQSCVEVSSKEAPLTREPMWEVDMVQDQGSITAAFDSIPQPVDTEDLKQGKDGGEEQMRTEPPDFGCIAIVDGLEKPDEDLGLSQNLGGSVQLGGQAEVSVPQPMQAQGQNELFDPQTLQTVVTSCEIPDQRTALEGSQLIIITGPSYEALTSEGIQLNMGGGSVEEVTCTVIGGVTYNQMCTPDSRLRTTEDEDSMAGLSDKQLLHPTVDPLELSSNGELPRSLSRSKRNRRGPVIEPDGMLKMFHCPYEGCSQVYIAISSFQNHVNLVHRKGRTKVCQHPGCGKKFYLSNHLHRHMIIHSGVRDFICETCGKSFKRKNHLEVHRRTHTGETPLQCEICGYQCRQRASLNWHMKKHTPEAHYNFTCEFCNKRFEKLGSVKFHKLKSHPDKLAT
ncbi:zinc finger protein 653 [Pholidichthys leucotaenia]